MNVAELCQKQTVTVLPSDDLVSAAQLMREKHVGFLVVIGPGAEDGDVVPIGILTDRDIVVAAVARGIDPTLLNVGDVMTSNPTIALAEDTVTDAIQQMRHAGVRRLPVTGERGKLVGVLSLDDILMAHADEAGALAAAIVRERKHEMVNRT
jgi:CBS domain-containing protein